MIANLLITNSIPVSLMRSTTIKVVTSCQHTVVCLLDVYQFQENSFCVFWAYNAKYLQTIDMDFKLTNLYDYLYNTKRQRYAINLDIFFITKPSNIFGLLNLSEQWFKHLSDIKTSYFFSWQVWMLLFTKVFTFVSLCGVG